MPAPIGRALAPEIARVVKRKVARSGMPVDDFEDLEQTTWVRLLERLCAAPEVLSLGAFACGVAQNVIRENKRTLTRSRHLDGNDIIDVDEFSPDVNPLFAESMVEHHELAERVESALLQLSPCDRWLIDVRFFKEASYAEMLPRFWRRFGRRILTEEGLRTAVFHARSALMRLLEEGDQRLRRIRGA